MTLYIYYIALKRQPTRNVLCVQHNKDLNAVAKKGQSMRKKEFLGTRTDCLKPNTGKRN